MIVGVSGKIGSGKNEVLGDSDVYNVSLLDENYDLIYKPLILNVNEHS